MNSPDLVQELGRRLNLTELTFKDGICRLIFDRTLPIDIEDDGVGNLTFHTVVGALPHEGREAFLMSLLSAHLFGLDTDGAVFGLHPRTLELYLFRSLPVEALDVEGTLSVLERFAQQAESWKKHVVLMIRDAAPGSSQSLESDVVPQAIRA